MSSVRSVSGVSGSGPIKYVYELPYFDRKEICRIFDENSQWETLGGGLMGYSTSELGEFGRAVYRGGSPTDALLTSWGNQNHTLLELFTLCARLYHGRAMKVLAKYVDPKYHAYIPDTGTDFHATQELVGLEPPKPLLAGGVPELKVSPTKPKELDDKKGQAGGGDANKKEDGDKDEKNQRFLASLSESVGLLPQIAYADLTTATNGWDRRNMLGKGGFGTVYKGIWKSTPVAIKRMEQQRSNEAYVESQMKQSLGEMKFLNSYRHDNILPLYGFSLEGPHPCLVYQFMTNGSLEDRILCRQRTNPLSWHLRFHIAKGVACGIQFLHSIGPQPLIHGDIKSANILLDRNFEAKVGDFGLARPMAHGSSPNASYVKVSRVHGTRPYLPDEYLRSKKLSTKVDTYSFGIVLFELATGLRAYEEGRAKKFLKDMVDDFEGILDKLKDAKGGSDNPDVFNILMNIGKACVERLAKKRPEMVEVLKSLEAWVPYASQASSIRTLSTHGVTGLPYLFDMPHSRPASLGIPPVSSYTTNRNSPEIMRAGSPHWAGQGITTQGQGHIYNNPGFPSPGGVRKINQGSPLPSPLTPVVVEHSINSNNTNTTTSNNHNPNPLAQPLSIDVKPLIPDLVLNQPSPVPPQESKSQNVSPQGHAPLICERIEEVEDDDYFPAVVLERSASGGGAGGVADGDVSGMDEGTTAQSFDTVIPLITELGFKD